MNDPSETVRNEPEDESNVVWAIGRFRRGRHVRRPALTAAARTELAEILARGYFRLPRGGGQSDGGAA